ncbi:MAG TPA: CoA-transferase [Burkholderiales bacterium]|nr:CoA-transferase [Burkholderiales bacterium]
MVFSQTELLICTIAELLQGCRYVAVGESSPIPGAGAFLASRLSGSRLRVCALGSKTHNFFVNGSVELFDLAAQGRIDAFFLGGGEIDGQGNINLVGTGTYPRTNVRWPGSFGSSYLYFLIPRVILFREEHSRRVMVPKVDFISAPGVSATNIHRPGGPYALLTELALFMFDKTRRRFRLESVHPGHTLDEVRDRTGFEFDVAESLHITPAPNEEWIDLIRGPVKKEIAEIYPLFALGLDTTSQGVR